MELLPKPPTRRAVGAHFAGDVFIDVVVPGGEESALRASFVRFAPGARNAWHNHVNGQTLHVTEGVGRIQSRGCGVVEIRAGDTVYTPAGEWHWHGAAPDHFMTHLALFEGARPGQGEDAEWGDPVTDAEYLGR